MLTMLPPETILGTIMLDIMKMIIKMHAENDHAGNTGGVNNDPRNSDAATTTLDILVLN